MSDVGSGLIKLAYRGVAGFVVLLLMFVVGVTGTVLSLAGGIIIAISWIPLAYPEILNDVPILVIGTQGTTSPLIATAGLLLAGIILMAIGFLFLVFTYFLGKGAIQIDKQLSSAVDRTFSGTDRISRLERLAALRERGSITDSEFEKEKERILGPKTE